MGYIYFFIFFEWVVNLTSWGIIRAHQPIPYWECDIKILFGHEWPVLMGFDDAASNAKLFNLLFSVNDKIDAAIHKAEIANRGNQKQASNIAVGKMPG